MSRELRELRSQVTALKRQRDQLRNALAPFASLGRNELRQGDFNRARRAMATTRATPEHDPTRSAPSER